MRAEGAALQARVDAKKKDVNELAAHLEADKRVLLLKHEDKRRYLIILVS
jgi:hypothetical protein